MPEKFARLRKFLHSTPPAFILCTHAIKARAIEMAGRGRDSAPESEPESEHEFSRQA